MAYLVNDSSLMDSVSESMTSTFLQPSFISQPDLPARVLAMQRLSGVDIDARRRNLFDSLDEASVSHLPIPSSKETVAVYLRVKPKTIEESQLQADSAPESVTDGQSDVVTIESVHQIALTAPKESYTYKNAANGVGSVVHRYTFSKIFAPSIDQSELFQEMVLPKVKAFLEGQNQLIFAYGATSSGKTHTIQGSNEDPGILPRALDVIFHSVGKRQMTGLDMKPNCFNRVIQMKEKDVKKLEEDKQKVFTLGLDLQNQDAQGGSKQQSKQGSSMFEDSFLSNITNLSQESLVAMFPRLSNRVKDETTVSLQDNNIQYAVWISFAEIYNETIYDLLENIPAPKHAGDKPKRNALKLAEDSNGSIYIKGLKEIKVNSADEAFQIMAIGRANLHFASTRLNQHSSRSHCIFTVKVIRVADVAKPNLARVSTLSFCDLAGSERIKKTLNTGERQKEAGNINTSLLILGRCIKTIRENQLLKDAKKKQMVPYRESKLTRMFQSFLVGHGKASMVVNVSQAPYLFDESMQVLKFAAIANKVTITQIVQPETVKANKRKTRFSILVTQANPLMGRGSIAWEDPKSRSTMCPAASSIDEEEPSFAETTVVDGQYDALLKVIDNLKDQLAKEHQEKQKIEGEIRTELCGEFNNLLVEIDQQWRERLENEKEKTEELWQLKAAKLAEAVHGRRSAGGKEADESGLCDNTLAFQKEEMKLAFEDKEVEVKCLEEKVDAMSKTYKVLADDHAKVREDLSRCSMDLKAEKLKCGSLQSKLTEALQLAEDAKNAYLEKQGTDNPIIENLTQQLSERDARISALEAAQSNLRELLDEASLEYCTKEKEIVMFGMQVKKLEDALQEQTEKVAEQNSQLEDYLLLLSASAKREEASEKRISELEEQLELERGEEKEKDARDTRIEELEETVRKLQSEADRQVASKARKRQANNTSATKQQASDANGSSTVSDESEEFELSTLGKPRAGAGRARPVRVRSKRKMSEESVEASVSVLKESSANTPPKTVKRRRSSKGTTNTTTSTTPPRSSTRKLFKETAASEIFTPPEVENTPETPATIVKRQLRTRKFL